MQFDLKVFQIILIERIFLILTTFFYFLMYNKFYKDLQKPHQAKYYLGNLIYNKILKNKDFKKYAKRKPKTVKDIKIIDNWARLKTIDMCVI